MKRFRTLASATLAALLAAGAQAVTVDIYNNYTSDPETGAITFSDFANTFTSPDIQFATNTEYRWHPFNLAIFGADIHGQFNVSADDTYTFELDSDDGSQFFIDGALVIDNGQVHGPEMVTGIADLTSGVHSFRVTFFEDMGGESGVDLNLPQGVTYATIPEPSAYAMLLAGLGLLTAVVIRRRRA